MNIKHKLDGVIILDDGREIRYTTWPETASGPVEKQNCYYDGTVKVKTATMFLNELKQQFNSFIHDDCEFEMKTNNQGIVSTAIGAKIDCREIDVLRIDQLIDLMIADGATEDTTADYILYDNTIKKVKLKDIRKAKIEMIRELMNMLYYKHELYGLVNAAIKESDLFITSTTGGMETRKPAIVWTWNK